MTHVWSRRLVARLRRVRFDLCEVSGAMGDLGTFIPIVVSLVAVCKLDIGTVLAFAGMYNIITGLLFNQPIPVQPMKAIAAVAIAESLSPGAIAAAGLGAGLIVFLLGVTGWVDQLERLIPRPIVRGIQLGVGLKLLVKGVVMIEATSWTALDGWAAAAVAAAFIIVSTRWRRFPTALIVFVAGLGLMLLLNTGLRTGATPMLSLHDLSWGWGGPALIVPSLADWKLGLSHGTLPQVPLTLLNSVIAVCALSSDLYPGRGIAKRPMAISVGLMNIGGCFFGAMPMCHGAGGLAGQHRFGARTGGSVVLLGAAKVLLAVALGSTAALLLAAYPPSILGVLLCFAGAELALPARDCTERDAFFLAVLTAGGILSFNTAVGFVLGLFAALLMRAARGSPPNRG